MAGTRETIMAVAKKHFLEKGFKEASLRQIVKEAGVTTGAFYGYFANKEAVFAALVDALATDFLKAYEGMIEQFDAMPCEEKFAYMQSSMERRGDELIDYAMDNQEAFLLLFEAEGTAYGNFLDKMLALEVPHTMALIRDSQRDNPAAEPVDEQVVGLMLKSFYTSFIELMKMRLNRETASRYLGQMARFHQAGWNKLLFHPMNGTDKD